MQILYFGRLREAFGRGSENLAPPADGHEQKLTDGRWLKITERKTSESGTVSIYSDITQLKDREESLKEREHELNQKESELTATERAKNDFLTMINREIRGPMQEMLKMTHKLADGDESGPALEGIDPVISDILDFSALDIGQLFLKNVPFELTDVITETFNDCEATAMTKGIALECDIAPSVPMSLIGDPGRVGQIILNLVDNALKFTEHGSVSIQVTAPDIKKDEATLHFKVTDTGPGIPHDKLESIFDRFSTRDNYDYDRNSISGLGLAICKRLVHLMEGDIGVSSEMGVGSTFWYTLKLKVQQNSVQNADPSTTVSPLV